MTWLVKRSHLDDDVIMSKSAAMGKKHKARDLLAPRRPSQHPRLREELRELMKKLELIGTETGDVLGISPRQFARYVSGTSRLPAPTVKLLRIAVKRGISKSELAET